MKIGLTYDLKKVYLAAGLSEEQAAEFDSEDTIAAIADALIRLGHTPVMIGNINALVKQLASNQRWDLVFNIAEGLWGRNRESQVPAILEAYQIPYTFSDPLTLSMSLDKAMTKRLVDHAGVPTAKFAVVADLSQLHQAVEQGGLAYPLFVKPVYEGTGKGIQSNALVRHYQDLQQTVAAVLDQCRQPVLVEEYLPGRELTVGIIGTGAAARVLGTLEIKMNAEAWEDFYSYRNKKYYHDFVRYELVQDQELIRQAATVALTAYQTLECRDVGRVDLREDRNGRLHFMEINPLPGLNPVDSDLPILCRHLGMPYPDLIKGIVCSAQERMPPLPATDKKAA